MSVVLLRHDSRSATSGGVSDPLEPRLNPLEELLQCVDSRSDSQVNRVAWIELVVAFDRVLILAIPGNPVGVKIAEADGIGSRVSAARDGEEVAKRRSAVDLEVFDPKRI